MKFAVEIAIEVVKEVTKVNLIISVVELGEALLSGNVDKIIEAVINVAAEAIPLIGKIIDVVEAAKDIYKISTEKDPDTQKEMATKFLTDKIKEKIVEKLAGKANGLADNMQKNVDAYQKDLLDSQQNTVPNPNPDNQLPTVVANQKAEETRQNISKVRQLSSTLKAYSESRIPAKTEKPNSENKSAETENPNSDKIEIPAKTETPQPETPQPENRIANPEKIDISNLAKEEAARNDAKIPAKTEKPRAKNIEDNVLQNLDNRISQDPNDELRKEFEITIGTSYADKAAVEKAKTKLEAKVQAWEKTLLNTKDIEISEQNLNPYSKKYTSASVKPQGDVLTLQQVEKKYGKKGLLLVETTQKKAKEVVLQAQKGNNSLPAKGPVLAGGIDVEDPNGAIVFGQNFPTDEKGTENFQKFIENSHPLIQKRYQEHKKKIESTELSQLVEDPKGNAQQIIDFAGNPASHAEIRVLDQLLKRREERNKKQGINKKLTETDLQDFMIHNRNLDKRKVKNDDGTKTVIDIGDSIPPRCVHCFYLTNGVVIIGND